MNEPCPFCKKEVLQVGWCWIEGVSTDDYTCKFQPWINDYDNCKWFIDHKWTAMFIRQITYEYLKLEEVTKGLETVRELIESNAPGFAITHINGMLDNLPKD